ncbi:two-component system response regulator ResD [Bacillus pakistanensis]|uniref:Two-component system response regulator ResD n=1 Tax=Rossellomorea pakistanensis TaxID=992288 RepID=A0ABS2NHQ9_9BACI|nr:response regulator transcription factor [Bacillus pakistanensis]MBM7587398.1 two-component system response regulator ResD [Bacillus pakistanensis]
MSNKKTILIVDDEWNMRNLLKIHLSKNFNVIEATDGYEALSKMVSEVDLVILDVMMPDMSGWEVCEKVRRTSDVPIIMLTARGEITDKVQGFGVGADDYLVKPFNIEELILRVNALIRRSSKSFEKETPTGKEFVYQDLTIEFESRIIRANHSTVDLTPKEYDLLLFFISNSNKVFSRDQLLDQIWGINEVLDYRTIDTHIKNIREKLKKSKLSFNPIKTVWGVGYKFEYDKELL